ncbi:MAG: GDSL-type esterase/lipase family protein [Verrucomicrobiota bacterium]
MEISLEGDNWQVEAKAYRIRSQKGYLNSLEVDGVEFLAQEKVPAGSYLAQGGMPALTGLKKVGEAALAGSNELGKVNYQFSEQEIVCTYHNTSDKSAVYYFIINQAVSTVIANNAEMLELPAKTDGRTFKWIQGDRSLEFQAESSIWGPWKEHQVFQIRIAAGESGEIKIVPGAVLDTDSFNRLKGVSREKVTQFDYRASEQSKQIPLCMIGDSITWAGKGDHWRKSLLELLPNLAFIGNHSAVLGYSHAGEGGDGTRSVLARITSLPDCPNYSLLIGTNNNGVKEAGELQMRAKQTAEDIIKIVKQLLQKEKTEKVFLSSILPCFTKNPLRDQCNSESNRILREQFKTAFPSGKVIWVEYEKPIREIDGWEEKIKLHPTPEGYGIMAGILAKTIKVELPDKGKQQVEVDNSGVQVLNLIDKDRNTDGDLVAGWYTLSFKVDSVQGAGAKVVLRGNREQAQFPFELSVDVSVADKKVSHNFFTQYERYNYTRTAMLLEALGCEISEVLLEKTGPSMKASLYGEGSYIDSHSAIMPGELIEYKK